MDVNLSFIVDPLAKCVAKLCYQSTKVHILEFFSVAMCHLKNTLDLLGGDPASMATIAVLIAVFEIDPRRASSSANILKALVASPFV